MNLMKWWTRQRAVKKAQPKPFRPVLESLEDRFLPATSFEWNTGAVGNWSDPTKWTVTGGPPGRYPGEDPSAGDIADISGTGSACTLDEPVTIAEFHMTLGTPSLTIPAGDPLTVQGGTNMNASFSILGNGTIYLCDTLTIANEIAWWSNGSFVQGAGFGPGSVVLGNGANLEVSGLPQNLGVNLTVSSGAICTLTDLSKNVSLGGSTNTVTVNSGGWLKFDSPVDGGDEGKYGGFVHGPGHSLYVAIENQGYISRDAGGTQQTWVAIHNNGGQISIQQGTLDVRGKEFHGYNIYQEGAANTHVFAGAGLTTPNGINGKVLFNVDPRKFLTFSGVMDLTNGGVLELIDDTFGSCGTLTFNGTLEMDGSSTLYMNGWDSTGASDMIAFSSGEADLAGTINVHEYNQPTTNVWYSFITAPTITGGFSTIINNNAPLSQQLYWDAAAQQWDYQLSFQWHGAGGP
jgi:hypothetical protein